MTGSIGESAVKLMVLGCSRSTDNCVATKLKTPEFSLSWPRGRMWAMSASPSNETWPLTSKLTTGGTPGTPGETEYRVRRSGPSISLRSERRTVLGVSLGRVPPRSS